MKWTKVISLVRSNTFDDERWNKLMKAASIGLVDETVYLLGQNEYHEMPFNLFMAAYSNISDISGNRTIGSYFRVHGVPKYKTTVFKPWFFTDPSTDDEFNTFVPVLNPNLHIEENILCSDIAIMWFSAIAQNPSIRLHEPLVVGEEFHPLIVYLSSRLFGKNIMGMISSEDDPNLDKYIIRISNKNLNIHNLIVTDPSGRGLYPGFPTQRKTSSIIPSMRSYSHPELMLKRNDSHKVHDDIAFLFIKQDKSYNEYKKYCFDLALSPICESAFKHLK